MDPTNACPGFLYDFLSSFFCFRLLAPLLITYTEDYHGGDSEIRMCDSEYFLLTLMK